MNITDWLKYGCSLLKMYSYRLLSFIFFCFIISVLTEPVSALKYREDLESKMDEHGISLKILPDYKKFLQRCALEDNYCASDCHKILKYFDMGHSPQNGFGISEIVTDQIATYDIFVVYDGGSDVGFEYIMALNKPMIISNFIPATTL